MTLNTEQTEKHQSLAPLLSLLSDKVAPAYVAGGYAVDPLKAQDIDIFFLYRGLDVEETKEKCKQVLLSSEFLPLTNNVRYSKEFEVIGIGTHDGKPVQFVWTSTTEINNLLNNFDFTVHMKAIGADGLTHRTHETTELHQPIAHGYLYDMPRSFTRMCKLAKRYDLPVAPATVEAFQQWFFTYAQTHLLSRPELVKELDF